ncbi:Solute carrier family 25 member 36-A [Porphyridium purpureum]|uniref:Solute carrier family 25 member 36-A n=1 Tax=Porphyridium purpureum TaxID=35688 RepID=A0A5J4YM57_PORPP|nr:Solute carrier family 25 member 36-A [Porphyridium purpureum]|eukprot:POR4497..scf291_13
MNGGRAEGRIRGESGANRWFGAGASSDAYLHARRMLIESQPLQRCSVYRTVSAVSPTAAVEYADSDTSASPARGGKATQEAHITTGASHGSTSSGSSTSSNSNSSSSMSSSSSSTIVVKSPVMPLRKQIASLMAGALGGTVASCVTCPLEVVKTKLQSSGEQQHGRSVFTLARQIMLQDGARGFFRGLAPTVIGIIPARGTYFWAYATTKTFLVDFSFESDSRHENASSQGASSKQTDSEGSPFVHVLAGASASFASNTVTNPIWLVKTRMQLQAGQASGGYSSYGHAVQQILKEEGVRGFFKGLAASYWGVSEAMVQFVVYEKLKGYLRERDDLSSSDTLKLYEYFFSAAFAKLLASSLTYPHEVVRTRMREERKLGAHRQYRGMLQSLLKIGREEGRRGLYAGMLVHLSRVVPNTAIMFLTYETAVRIFAEKFDET